MLQQSIRLARRSLIAVAFAAPFEAVIAQRSVVIHDSPACSGCSLKVDTIMRLGKATDPYLFNNYPSVQRDSRRRFVVFATIPRSTVLVFDSTGNHTAVWGREGEGPGEFRGIWMIKMLAGDSLLVVDLATRRLTVLDGTGRYARSFTVPFAPLDIHLLSADRWVLAGVSYSDEHIGYPLHLYSSSGAHVSSFGGDVAVLERHPSISQRCHYLC